MAQRPEQNGSKPPHDEIAQRAREIYERSGRVPGRDLENWLEAESQIVTARKPEREAKPQAVESRPASRALAKATQRA